VFPDSIESVYVLSSLCIRGGECGGQPSQDVAKEDHPPQHEDHRQPLLCGGGGENVTIAVGGRERERERERERVP